MPNQFLEEYPNFLESIPNSNGHLLIVGDFNIHVYLANDSIALKRLNILECFNLTQQVISKTHSSGHTLDLVITRRDNAIANNF